MKTDSPDVKIHCNYDELEVPSALQDHPKNRNKHGQDQIDRLAEIYQYQGIRHPIIVSKRSGFIVAGHGRKLAAIRAGVKEFPVVYQDFESDEQEYAFIQSDNAIALWADLDLAGINADLPDLGPDFNIEMLGIKNFTLDPWESDIGDVDKVDETDQEAPDIIKVRCPKEMKSDLTAAIKELISEYDGAEVM